MPFLKEFSILVSKILWIKSYYVMDDDCGIDHCNEVDCEWNKLKTCTETSLEIASIVITI